MLEKGSPCVYQRKYITVNIEGTILPKQEMFIL